MELQFNTKEDFTKAIGELVLNGFTVYNEDNEPLQLDAREAYVECSTSFKISINGEYSNIPLCLSGIEYTELSH